MVNQDIVLRLLASIEGFVSDLRQAEDITYQRFMHNIRDQRFVERTLQIAVEACMDVAHHIISDEKWREPDSYADAFSVLAENGVITMEQAERYALMARFRNRIVHYYEKVEPEQVFAIFKKHLGDFDDFAASIRNWMTPSD
ncbi:DUF86 domain-containing protein [Desulfonatronospira sp.]|uniref:type VII toxin-antitoxin system HepT family RNase toxin n=1 Tax=Desulfonatronospira sp. TaxID=1962951 RepID=UPI0025C19409|nr:DUF86 domain-containing protein [Desulfonatronospira sp.]